MFRVKLTLFKKYVLKDCCNNLIFATDCYLLHKREINECFECRIELFRIIFCNRNPEQYFYFISSKQIVAINRS